MAPTPQTPIPNPQSPIPNPQSPIINEGNNYLILNKNFKIILLLIKIYNFKKIFITIYLGEKRLFKRKKSIKNLNLEIQIMFKT